MKAKLFSQVVVRAKHIHRNDFHLTTNGSIVAKKVISDDSLCSAFKSSDDIEFVKILSNETHLHLPIETVTSLTVSTSKIRARWSLIIQFSDDFLVVSILMISRILMFGSLISSSFVIKCNCSI